MFLILSKIRLQITPILHQLTKYSLKSLILEIVIFGAALTLLTFSITFIAVKKVKHAIKRGKLVFRRSITFPA